MSVAGFMIALIIYQIGDICLIVFFCYIFHHRYIPINQSFSYTLLFGWSSTKIIRKDIIEQVNCTFQVDQHCVYKEYKN